MASRRISRDGRLIVPPSGSRFAEFPSRADKAKTFLGATLLFTTAAAGTVFLQAWL